MEERKVVLGIDSVVGGEDEGDVVPKLEVEGRVEIVVVGRV
jgi:hypothetical protein